MTTTYTIRPVSGGFGVFRGRTILGRMKQVGFHERLFDAEMSTLHAVTQDYHRELDYRGAVNQSMSTDMMNPRRDEEHIYTALLLAGKRPRNGDDMENEARFAPVEDPEFKKFDNILETHLGKPIPHTSRVMFEERFMTWYGAHNPQWVDPRRERDYNPALDRYGRNRYGGAVAAGPPPPAFVKRWIASLGARAVLMRRAIFGPALLTAEDMKRAADAMNQSQAVSSIGGR